MAQIKQEQLYQADIYKNLIDSAKLAEQATKELDTKVVALSKSFAEIAKQTVKLDSKSIQALNKAYEGSVKALEKSIKIEESSKKIKKEVADLEQKRAKSISAVQKAQEKLAKASGEEGKQLAIIAERTKKVNKENREAAQLLVNQADAYDKLVIDVNKAQKRLKLLAATFGVNSKEAKEAKEQFDLVEKELRDINDAAKDGRRDVGRYGIAIEKLKEEMNGLGGSADNATGGLVSFAKNLATNPIGAGATALTALGGAFASTEGGARKLDTALAASKGVFNTVTSGVGGFVNALTDGKSVTEAYNENLDGIVEKSEKAAKSQIKASDAAFNLRGSIRSANIELAKYNAEFEFLSGVAGDATITLEEQQAATILAQEKAVQIAEAELSIVNKQIERIQLLIDAREGLNNQDLLDEQNTFVTQQIEIQGRLNNEVRTLEQERRQIEQDQWEQRLDFLFDASDRQKSVNERILQDDRLSVDERKKILDDLNVSIKKTYKEIEAEFRRASNQQIDLPKFAALEATEQAKLLKTLNLSEIQRNRLREGVVEYLAVVQDLDDAQKDLNEREEESFELTKKIELQRKAISDSTFDLDKALNENEKQNLQDRISALKENSLERLRLEVELNNLLLEEQKRFAEEQKKQDEKNLSDRKEQDDEIQRQKEESYAKQKEAEEKRAQEQKELTEASIDAIGNLINNSINKQVEAIDKQLTDLSSRTDSLRQSAALGNAESVESLALADKKQAELTAKKEQELKKQKQVEAGLAAYKVFAAKTEAGDKNALGSTLKELLSLDAFVAALPTFYSGADHVGSAMGAPHLNTQKDAYIARVDKNERIVDPTNAALIGYNTPNSLVGEVMSDFRRGFLTRGDSVAPPVIVNMQGMVVKELQTQNELLKKLPNMMPRHSTDYDTITKIVSDIEKRNTVTTVRRRKL